jgi:hypothetical protein
MNRLKIPPAEGFLWMGQPKLFLNWSVDQWGFWHLDLLDLE